MIPRPAVSELPQEAEVVLPEEADVVDAVLPRQPERLVLAVVQDEHPRDPLVDVLGRLPVRVGVVPEGGRGLVDPVDDWEKGRPTHPELLRWLGREFVRGGYDVKQLARVILTSHAYQRATDASLKEPHPLYAAPAPRRLSAEQIVDSLFAATGRSREPVLGVPGTRGHGAVSSGSLEASNVDLAREFVTMIAVQRGFQSNSRTISTADEMLTDIVALKR